LWGALGYPVSEERLIQPGDSARIQFFDNGSVTLRDGKAEISLYTDEDEPDPQLCDSIHVLGGPETAQDGYRARRQTDDAAEVSKETSVHVEAS
jgi:hypothetical protein